MHVCGRVVLVISFFFFFFSFFLFRFPFLALVCCSFRFGAWTGQDTKKWWHVGHVWLCTPCTQTPLGYTFMCSSGVISQWPVSVKLDSQARCLPARFFFFFPGASKVISQPAVFLLALLVNHHHIFHQAKREAGKAGSRQKGKNKSSKNGRPEKSRRGREATHEVHPGHRRRDQRHWQGNHL